MMLVDLAPRWYALEAGGPRVGFTFDCPHCRFQRLGVLFVHEGHEAIEEWYIRAQHDQGHLWTLNGQDDFGTLTLTPSVDASASGHWHGWLTRGMVL
jgi:Family of unknown function (DUF6527)